MFQAAGPATEKNPTTICGEIVSRYEKMTTGRAQMTP